MPNVPLRIMEGDTLVVDGTPYTVTSPTGEKAFADADPEEWQLSVPSNSIDVVKTPAEFDQMLDNADSVVVFRP